MKSLRYIFMLFIAFMIVGCTPPERIKDNQSTDNTENIGGVDNDNNGSGAENSSKPQTSAPYQVGDYFNESGKEGVVFYVDEDGNNGKIISLLQSAETMQWTSDAVEQNRAYGATNSSEGLENFAKIAAIADWKSKYPAFKWCADLGDGWYLPAIEELKKFTINDTIHNAVNRTLAAKGANKLCNRGEYECNWSSTEGDIQIGGVFCAWLVFLSNGGTYIKDSYGYVRAVSAF